MDDVKVAELAYQAARDARKRAQETEERMYKIWMDARIAKASVEAHPFANKDVKRAVTQRGGPQDYGYTAKYNKDRIITQRGHVVLADNNCGYYRNHMPVPGSWFVLSKNGLTAYSLDDSWELDE